MGSGRRLAVYEAPPVPEVWVGITPIRIIDPLGVQAAWVAPVQGGSLAGWFARRSPVESWEQLLGGTNGGAGIELLAASTTDAPMRSIAELVTRWRFEERDPTAVRVEGTFDGRVWSVSYRCDEVLQVHLHGTDAARVGLRLRLRQIVTAAVEQHGAGGRASLHGGEISNISWWHDLTQESVLARGPGGDWRLDVLSAQGTPPVVNLSVEAHPNTRQ